MQYRVTVGLPHRLVRKCNARLRDMDQPDTATGEFDDDRAPANSPQKMPGASKRLKALQRIMDGACGICEAYRPANPGGAAENGAMDALLCDV